MMRDPGTFEDRFTAVVGRYLDSAPTAVDPMALAREIAARPRRSSLVRRARPLRLVLVLGLLLAAALAAAALVGALPSPRFYSGVFTPTGSMIVVRNRPDATLLRDGRVLITGGVDSQYRFIAMAELYDPGSGTFSETGQLTAAVDCCLGFGSGYAIAPLADGRALVVGGERGGGPNRPIANAEVYDPRTGTFTPTGPLIEPRGWPTATLLVDGRVLVAGGFGEAGTGRLMTAELYDPATGTFTATGSSGRGIDTATSLTDGRVLVTGTDGRSPTPAWAELYDPTSGRFTPTGPMIALPDGYPDITPTAMLLPDGRVLVTFVTYSDHMIAEVYDPVTDTFASTGPFGVTGRYPATTLLQDGRLLILGGDHPVDPAGDYQPLASAELYDPQTGTLTPTASLNEPRLFATATLLQDGHVLVAGGAGQDDPLLRTAELYR